VILLNLIVSDFLAEIRLSNAMVNKDDAQLEAACTYLTWSKMTKKSQVSEFPPAGCPTLKFLPAILSKNTVNGQMASHKMSHDHMDLSTLI
jgi:hypothetical protein